MEQRKKDHNITLTVKIITKEMGQETGPKLIIFRKFFCKGNGNLNV